MVCLLSPMTSLLLSQCLWRPPPFPAYQAWWTRRCAFQILLQGRTCCPAAGSAISRRPPATSPFRSFSAAESHFDQSHALLVATEQKGSYRCLASLAQCRQLSVCFQKTQPETQTHTFFQSPTYSSNAYTDSCQKRYHTSFDIACIPSYLPGA